MSCGALAAPLDETGSRADAFIFEDRETFDLGDYEGKVLVLELGAVGCPLTNEIYSNLVDLRDEYDERVAFVKVDFGQSLKQNSEYYKKNEPNFHVIGDPSGKIGKLFPSQAYPTLYLFGKWGKMRFMGGFESGAFRSMVNRLAAEKKVNEKNFFLERTLGKGDVLPPFTLTDLAGEKISLDDYRRDAKAFVLVFAGTGCPISTAAVKALNKLAKTDGYEALSVLVVNIGQKAGAVKKVYEPMGLPFSVLVDPDETLVKPFGIETVPTLFVAAKTGKVELRSLWQYEAIKQEVDILLGKLKPEMRKQIEQQGSG